MSSNLGRALRGSCHCGRNQYIVQIPGNTSEGAQILFDSTANHRISSATPLSAFLRVPLSWYHSQIFPFFPDESRASIRRVYSHPAEQNAMRQFCGFCGTPLSYWSEEPRSEADYIQVTLGSLLTEDLHDLEELGLLPEEPAPEIMDIIPTPRSTQGSQLVGRDITSIPWFESMILGSRLGNVHTTRGVRESRDGRVRVEYEITEWTGDDAADGETGEKPESSSASATGKRKRGEADGDGGNTA
ncbi:LRR receptor-like serine/threonine-protein kinase RGI2 [Hypoxylon texense]